MPDFFRPDRIMLPLETIAVFFATALLLGVAPGPDNIFVLTQSALYGTLAGIVTTLGLASGLCVHTALVALGMTVLLQSLPWAFTLLKTAGAIYLLRLAWLCFHTTAIKADILGKKTFPGYAALYRRGIVMNITNPKVSLFFLSFLPQFCDAGRGSVFWQTLGLGGLFICATLLVFCSAAILGGHLAARLNSSLRAQKLTHYLSGIIFILLASMLFLSD